MTVDDASENIKKSKKNKRNFDRGKLRFNLVGKVESFDKNGLVSIEKSELEDPLEEMRHYTTQTLFMEVSNYQPSLTNNATKKTVSVGCQLWTKTPDENVELILLYALQQSGLTFPGHN